MPDSTVFHPLMGVPRRDTPSAMRRPARGCASVSACCTAGLRRPYENGCLSSRPMRRMRSRMGVSLAWGGLLRSTSKNTAKNADASMAATCSAGVPSGTAAGAGAGMGRPLPIGAEPTPGPVCG
ncbi:hypothetical protein D3C72_2097110 [compost metagenome]